MFCSNCGTKIDESSLFCVGCGHRNPYTQSEKGEVPKANLSQRSFGNRRVTVILGAVFIVAAITLLSFFNDGFTNGNASHEIVGRWQSEDSPSWSEYFADGTVRIYYPKLETTLGGTYTFLDDGRLKVEMSALGVTDIGVYGVSIMGDELTFTYENGSTAVYHRIR